MYEAYQEEDVNKTYPKKTAGRGNTTNDGPPNNGVPRDTGTEDVAKRAAVPKAASEKGEHYVKNKIDVHNVKDSIDVPNLKDVPDVPDVP